jgi:archaellum biogenesis ATPase FlaH
MINLEESIERNARLINDIHFPTNLNHLRDHNGFRPGELAALVGIKGGGKSTIFRTWINECLLGGKKVYVRLSEETSQTYTDQIVVELGKMMPVDGMELLKIDSEIELSHDQLGAQYFEDLRLQLRNFNADILFLDNFTTSELTECNIGLQSKNAKELRKLAEKLKIPIIVATHTMKGFKSSSIASGDEVRGSMTLINTAAYIYTINVLFGHADKPTILFVDKARYHTNSNKALYRLYHHAECGLFVKDEKTSKAMVLNLLKEAL